MKLIGFGGNVHENNFWIWVGIVELRPSFLKYLDYGLQRYIRVVVVPAKHTK